MLAQTSSRPGLALGVCLGNRAAGVALATSEQLIRAEVLDLRRTDPPRRVLRLFARLEKLAGGYAPGRIALVEMDAPLALAELRAELVARLAEVTALRTVVLQSYAAAEVRRAHVPEGTCATNRALLRALAARFPELGDPTLRPIARVPVIVRSFLTPRERRATRLFLAVGVALHDLAEARRQSLSFSLLCHGSPSP